MEFPSGINNIILDYCCHKIPFEKELISTTFRILHCTRRYWCYDTYCINSHYEERRDAEFKFRKNKDKIWENPITFIGGRGEYLIEKLSSDKLLEMLFG